VRRNPIAQMVVFGVIATAIGLVIALLIPWFPAEGSKQAGNIRTLYRVLLFASVPVFVLVETVVVFAVMRFRMRPGQEMEDGPPIHGNTRLEVVWTIAPALLIVALCTYAYTVLRSNEDTKANELTVNVTARQFAFEFSYPQSSGKQVVSSVLYMPEGRPVVFKIRSLDVIHSFFVPNFSEKLDAVPGITTTLRVTATKTGSYPVECTELCGAGHGLMRAAVRVVSPSTFNSWLSSQKSTGAPPLGSPPPNGAQPGIPGSPSTGGASSGSAASVPSQRKVAATSTTASRRAS
jgi:cytochrome c oxidase subunit 2